MHRDVINGIDYIDVPKDEWPGAVSDGLSIKCGFCGKTPAVDYIVTDIIWRSVVPPNMRAGAICIDCFLKEARKKRIDVSAGFLGAQIATGMGATICVRTTSVYYYKEDNNEGME